MLTVGSLCSGYGGLDQGLALGLGVPMRTAWHVEFDKHPSAILALRYPGVPNYGDIKDVAWSEVERVDWLTAGYPCQPFSHAGKRKGVSDERHIWPYVAEAIGALRPGNVFLENVRGHVSLGLDAVLGDLADLGYDARWGVVRASDAGAPHGRARVFIVAADTEGNRRGQDNPQRRGLVREGGVQADGRESAGTYRPDSGPAVAWGVYEPAVRRWEITLGRSAPRPTEPAKSRVR